MTRHRNSSYSSDTLSSHSSRSSSDTYASIRSASSSTSRISSQIKSGEFWSRLIRKSPQSSVLSLLQHLFAPKVRGEPAKPSQVTTNSTVITIEHETSFTSFASLPSKAPTRQTSSSHCPVGLYCVIDDFLTEYDMRIMEEEERADLLARKSKEINKLDNSDITLL